MARDWVKLWTSMLHDPDINGMSPGHGWNWVRMMAMAGATEDGGRIGDVRSVAYVLRVSETSIEQTVEALDGRIVAREGQLYFRDWDEWQSMSVKERKRAQRSREKQEPNEPSPPVTDGHDPSRDDGPSNDLSRPVTSGHNGSRPVPTESRDVTPGHGSHDRRGEEKRREEKRGELTQGDVRPEPDGQEAGAAARAAPRWKPALDALSEVLGGVRVVNKRTGAPLAWAGEVLHVVGPPARDDPDKAAELIRQWAESVEPKYMPKPDNVAPKLGAWCAALNRKSGTSASWWRPTDTISAERRAEDRALLAAHLAKTNGHR